MSTAPADLTELARYLRSQDVPVVGIVGDASHRRGYHLGTDRLDDADYSLRTTRDRRGASIDASAIDIGRHGQLVELGRYLLASCRAGADGPPGALDVRELIAERGDGSHLWRWDRETGKVTGDPRSAELYHHLHLSTYRDSRGRSKVPLFAAFYLPDTSTGGDDVIYTLKGVPWPYACTVDAGTPYYSSADDPTPTGTITDASRPFVAIAESATGHRRAVVGRMDPDADRSVIGWVDARAVNR